MIDLKTTLFILGANDPEMQYIEDILLEENYKVAYATEEDGSRIAASLAYTDRCNHYTLVKDRCIEGITTYVTIENGLKFDCDTEVIKIDHHNEGDFGFGMEASQYWQASSVGQLFKLIGKRVNNKARLIAAGDHCPAAAYEGLCPNVVPSELLDHRIANRAKFMRLKYDEVMAMFEEAKELILDAKSILISTDSVFTVKDLTAIDCEQYPMIPEASAYLGIPITNKMYNEKLGTVCFMVKANNELLVKRWMEAAKENGLVNVYGDAVRGYAGGYVPV